MGNFIEENGLALLARVANVELKTVATTNLFTGPAGYKYHVDRVCFKGLPYSAAGTVVTFGKSTAKTDWLVAQTLTNFLAGVVGKFISPPVQHATIPTVTLEYSAGEIFCMDVTTGCTVASCIVSAVEIWGSLRAV
jgi:hypothetical protein